MYTIRVQRNNSVLCNYTIPISSRDLSWWQAGSARAVMFEHLPGVQNESLTLLEVRIRLSPL